MIPGKQKTSVRNAIPYIIGVSIIGIGLIVYTYAAGILAVFEAESGTLNGGAVIQSLTGASGGQSVKFGSGSVPTPAPSGIYGTSYNMDAVGNLQIGGMSSGQPNSYASIRFRAEQTGTLTNIRTYWVGAQFPGYGGGNGGAIRITVQSDNGGVPSGTVLASLDHSPGPVSQTFPLLTYYSPATLTSGTLYHLVFTNIDPSPTVNYSSINGTWMATSVIPRQPNISDNDYAMVTKYGPGSWSVNSRHTPIIELTYGNGIHQGQGYMEVEIAAQPLITGASSFVRERFTVSGGNRVVMGGAVRVAKTGGSGDLTIRLEDASGNLIDSFSVQASSVPTLPTTDNSSGVWVTGTFSSPRTLANGATYSLRLSTDSSTTYWSRGIQQGGTGYGFSSATYFSDGYLQFTTNGGTSWSQVSGLETDGDLQFYLR